MLVSLYTSRVVLQNLGIIDYGIYSLVSSIVMLFSFLNGALTEASQRFSIRAIEMNEQPARIFRNILAFHIGLIFLVLFLSEIFGVFLFSSKELDIPFERLPAAQAAYHCSVILSLLTILNGPYRSLIVANEDFIMYAYISIIEVVGKLLIAVLISFSTYDKLIIYAILLVLLQLLIQIIYICYCKKKYSYASFSLSFDRSIFKSVFSFSSWYLLGYLGLVLNKQGLKIVGNMFFGPVLNASIGIAEQVDNAVTTFRANLQTAINPQITKSYFKKDFSRLSLLIESSSKYSFFLIWALMLPIMYKENEILELWLGNYPVYSPYLINLMFIIAIIAALHNPLVIVNGAIGKLRYITSVQTAIAFLCVPISYILLRSGMDFYWPWIIYLVIQSLALFITFFYIKRFVGYSLSKYLKNVLIPITWVAILTILLNCCISYVLVINNLLLDIAVYSIISLVCTSFVVYFLGLNRTERNFIHNYIKRKFHYEN